MLQLGVVGIFFLANVISPILLGSEVASQIIILFVSGQLISLVSRMGTDRVLVASLKELSEPGSEKSAINIFINSCLLTLFNLGVIFLFLNYLPIQNISFLKNTLFIPSIALFALVNLISFFLLAFNMTKLSIVLSGHFVFILSIIILSQCSISTNSALGLSSLICLMAQLFFLRGVLPENFGYRLSFKEIFFPITKSYKLGISMLFSQSTERLPILILGLMSTAGDIILVNNIIRTAALANVSTTFLSRYTLSNLHRLIKKSVVDNSYMVKLFSYSKIISILSFCASLVIVAVLYSAGQIPSFISCCIGAVVAFAYCTQTGITPFSVLLSVRGRDYILMFSACLGFIGCLFFTLILFAYDKVLAVSLGLAAGVLIRNILIYYLGSNYAD